MVLQKGCGHEKIAAHRYPCIYPKSKFLDRTLAKLATPITWNCGMVISIVCCLTVPSDSATLSCKVTYGQLKDLQALELMAVPSFQSTETT